MPAARAFDQVRRVVQAAPDGHRGLGTTTLARSLHERGQGTLLAAFFLGCFVIGSYWAAHHRFMATLDAVDRGFIGLTVVYLAFVALLPFPTGVLGEFSSNPISMVAFALNMAAVSSIEAVMLVHARRRDLLRDQLSDDVYSWVLRMELSPVALFLVSMPVAFVAPWLAVVVWSLSVPLQAIWNRRRPGTASQYLS